MVETWHAGRILMNAVKPEEIGEKCGGRGGKQGGRWTIRAQESESNLGLDLYKWAYDSFQSPAQHFQQFFFLSCK